MSWIHQRPRYTLDGTVPGFDRVQLNRVAHFESVSDSTPISATPS